MLCCIQGRKTVMAKVGGDRANKKASAVLKRRRNEGVAKKRFKAASGRYERVAVLDANASSFGANLLKVFSENVAKARKENKRLFGSPDRVPAAK
jgi:hypothetical protein